MGKKESANMKGEEYLEGRRSGVEGTYGASRGSRGAEKTNLPHADVNDSGGAEELNEKASSLYRQAVMNEGDKLGDRALTER
jgi:hypothetical protein